MSGLFMMGALYTVIAPPAQVSAETGNSQQVAEGKALFAVGAPLPWAERRGPIQRHHPGSRLRVSARRRGLPGEHRTHADGQAGGIGTSQT